MKRVLIIAGSDASGGAGIQADIKTVTALGGYAMTAITAITAQNTLGVQGVHAVPPAMVAQQIESCLSDISADVIKTGMLLNAAIIQSAQAALDAHPAIPLILDPVMVSTSGARLLDETALDALQQLMPRAALITPNLPEAEILSNERIRSKQDMLKAAQTLQAQTGGVAILIKGGHLEGSEVHDLLLQEGEAFWYASPKQATRHTHGTGCTLASAIATYGAQGNPLFKAVDLARSYVQRAIAFAPGFGAGCGPLNHYAAASSAESC